MNIIPSIRNAPTGSILTGTAASAESASADMAVNLIIEDLDEFSAGIMLNCVTSADYIIGTALSSAYN